MNASNENIQNENPTSADTLTLTNNNFLQSEINDDDIFDEPSIPDPGTSLLNTSSDNKDEFDIEKENLQIIQNRLIPQLVENENQKRDFKYKMVHIITGCLIAQGLILLVPMAAIIHATFSSILKENDNLSQNLPEILSFLKYSRNADHVILYN